MRVESVDFCIVPRTLPGTQSSCQSWFILELLSLVLEVEGLLVRVGMRHEAQHTQRLSS